ncbi:MAG: enoyl-CoA hydratase-related protein, partial [Dehalococcoidales bacterium]|nr:enoyl-CoA hydratase-related protein [Dehalococcoidales bacterium]
MLVDCEKEGHIAVYTMNRPAAFNAVDVELFRDLHQRMMEFRDDDDIWVGIITGARTRAFSIGADTRDMLPFAREHRNNPDALPPSIMRGLSINKPLIA